MKCSRCVREISEDQSYEYMNERLCEDCYIDIRYPAKACDPWAVYAATRSREGLGLSGTGGLTELQKEICEFVKSHIVFCFIFFIIYSKSNKALLILFSIILCLTIFKRSFNISDSLTVMPVYYS